MLTINIIFLQVIPLLMPKHKLTLSIDKEIITQAKKQQINLSSFLEIRLIDYLSDKEKCSRRDSNPCSQLERLE